MKEYKTVRVAPEDVDGEVPCHEVFGWKLESTQEVYNESQEITGISGQSINVGQSNVDYYGIRHSGGSSSTQLGVQSRTKVTHFIALRFSRETTMPNYEKLKQLEQDYIKKDEEYKRCCGFQFAEAPSKLITFTVIAAIFGVIGIGLGVLLSSLLPLIVGIVAAVAAVVCLIVSIVIYVNRKKDAESVNEYNMKRKQDWVKEAALIYNQAKAIIES